MRIPTHSRRQAMDWSLALVSQGIESIIDQSDETGWGLLVENSDHSRALEIIRLYRVENARWPWRQRIHSKVLFDWGSIAWVILIAAFFWLDDTFNLKNAGVMDGAAIARGEWWRLFTAILLHADVGHLLSNAGIGLVLLGLAMGRYGTGIALLASYLAGAFGNFATWILDNNHRSLGASGMVMGALGLLAAQSPVLLRRNPRALRYVLSGIAAGAMLFVLLGLGPGTDILAHFGGFVGGLLIGGLLLLTRARPQSTAMNLLAGTIFAALIMWTWRLAFQANDV